MAVGADSVSSSFLYLVLRLCNSSTSHITLNHSD